MTQDHVLTDDELGAQIAVLKQDEFTKFKQICHIWGSVDDARADSAWDDDARRYLRELTALRRQWVELVEIREKRKAQGVL